MIASVILFQIRVLYVDVAVRYEDMTVNCTAQLTIPYPHPWLGFFGNGILNMVMKCCW